MVIGVALTHWPSLARLIRAEVIQLRESPYIQISCKLGKSSWYIARKHMLPHLVPQFIVGLVLMFPHAILHESSITFLGFGLSTEQPAIGIVLSEAMQYLITGKWENAGSRKYPSVKKPGGEKYGKRDSPENRTYEYCFYPV